MLDFQIIIMEEIITRKYPYQRPQNLSGVRMAKLVNLVFLIGNKKENQEINLFFLRCKYSNQNTYNIQRANELDLKILDKNKGKIIIYSESNELLEQTKKEIKDFYWLKQILRTNKRKIRDDFKQNHKNIPELEEILNNFEKEVSRVSRRTIIYFKEKLCFKQ